jgi:hypothetical protein
MRLSIVVEAIQILPDRVHPIHSSEYSVGVHHRDDYEAEMFPQ